MTMRAEIRVHRPMESKPYLPDINRINFSFNIITFLIITFLLGNDTLLSDKVNKLPIKII